jgi:hypothetical protein
VVYGSVRGWRRAYVAVVPGAINAHRGAGPHL